MEKAGFQTVLNYLKVTDITVEELSNQVALIFADYPPCFGSLYQLPVSDIQKGTFLGGFSISGYIETGKSTIANMLQKHGYRPLAFAGPLKDVVAYMWNLDRALLEGDTLESRQWREKPIGVGKPTARDVLQRCGTNVFRALSFGIWLDVMARRTYGKVFYTDTRFLNELNFAVQQGIETIRVLRPDLPIRANMHISETEHTQYTEYDYEIINDGTLEDLEYKVLLIINNNQGC